MAQLVGVRESFPTRHNFDGNFEELHEKQEEALDKLLDESEQAFKNDELVGLLARFHVADGYAWYRVVNDDPLQLEHIPFLDAYKIPDAHIRGLREEDIKQKAKSIHYDVIN